MPAAGTSSTGRNCAPPAEITSFPDERVPVFPQGRTRTSAYGMIYSKGGWTLHMVRGQMGDARFWKTIQFYAKKFTYQTATTSDFVEAISESTGQDLEWLFDQYVYKPGHPEFEVSWDYDSTNHLLQSGSEAEPEGGWEARAVPRADRNRGALRLLGARPSASGRPKSRRICTSEFPSGLGPFCSIRATSS